MLHTCSNLDSTVNTVGRAYELERKTTFTLTSNNFRTSTPILKLRNDNLCQSNGHMEFQVPKLRPHTLNLILERWQRSQYSNEWQSTPVVCAAFEPFMAAALIVSKVVIRNTQNHIWTSHIVMVESTQNTTHVMEVYPESMVHTFRAKQYVAPLPCTISFVMDRRTGEKGQASSANKQSRLYTQFL